MKKNLILSLIMLFISSLYAQSDFKEAYILISENDTVYGQIDNKNFKQNSLYCDFRKNEKDTIKRYYPKDLFAYRFIDGKYYISKSIKEDLKETSYFFEYLIKGEFDVYFIQKNLENLYYISEDGITLNKLKYSKNIIYKGNRMMLQENKQFIGLLDYYMIDYPELKKDIRKISAPDHKSLIKLSEKYHYLSCNGEQCIIYEKKIPREIKINMSASQNFIINERFQTLESKYPTYSSNLLFQISQKAERVYFGLGYTYSNVKLESSSNLGINMSFNYIHPKAGFSPLFSYSLVFPFFAINTLSVGTQYKIGKIALYLKGDLSTAYLIFPHTASIGFGLMLDLN